MPSSRRDDFYNRSLFGMLTNGGIQAYSPHCSLIVAMQYSRRDYIYNRLPFGMPTNDGMQAYSPYTENETNDAILSGWPHYHCLMLVLAARLPLLVACGSGCCPHPFLSAYGCGPFPCRLLLLICIILLRFLVLLLYYVLHIIQLLQMMQGRQRKRLIQKRRMRRRIASCRGGRNSIILYDQIIHITN